MLARLRKPWPDSRAERTLGAVSCLVGVLVVGMVVFVAVHAWPTFEHNGLSWLGSGPSPESSFEKMQATRPIPLRRPITCMRGRCSMARCW